MRLLLAALFFCFCGTVRAGGARPVSWLGNSVNLAQTPFCKANGCVLQSVRQNNENTLGWHDGSMRRYRLKDGSTLEGDVRPAGWISNARLFLPQRHIVAGRFRMSPNDQRLAAEFLFALTGRSFSAQAVAACERAGHALNDPDAYGPRQPMTRWSTPGGLPFVARCGIHSQLGVWAGWRQE